MVWTLIASVLGVLGFVMSVANLLRLRPVVFVTEPHRTYGLRDGNYSPTQYTFEVVNAGASPVTLSALAVGPDTAGGSLAHHEMGGLPPYLQGSRIPVRLDSYDTIRYVLDTTHLAGSMAPYSDGWRFQVEWYGRDRLWKVRVRQVQGKKIPRVVLEPESSRRLRCRVSTFDLQILLAPEPKADERA